MEPGTGQAASAAEDPAARTIKVLSPGIDVTATYDTDRPLVVQILASASLPQPAARGTAANGAQRALTPGAAAVVPAAATSYTGQGVDACSAPSSAYMSAWKSASPYAAVGIYIGGANRACAQPNLTASWVSQQAALGWHFLPTYVGDQAGQLTSPAAQGVAAAQDAVIQAAALGFGPGTPLYYDMEQYPAGDKISVLTFLSAWTTQLHAEGYKSGVYSSSSAGITDLVANLTAYAMPDVIWDALWNGDANTADPVIPAADWAAHQRAHQFSGGVNATFGGDTLNIDQDYLDIDVVPSPADPAQRALVTRGGAVSDFAIRADRNLYAYDQSTPGGSFRGPQKLTTSGDLTGTPVAVLLPARPPAANGAVWVFARTAGGPVKVLWQSAAGGAFNRSATLSGRAASSPAAIVTQNGTIALYATGANGQLYTWTQASPGGAFSGPSALTVNGGLTGTPVVVQNGNGAVWVFARTVHGLVRAKWQPVPGGPFGNSASLGGRIAGGIAALVAGGNAISLYATGTDGREYGDRQAVAGGAFGGWTVI